MPRSGLDEKDREILTILKKDSRIPITSLASQIGLASTPCKARIRRLERLRFIKRYTIEEGAAETKPTKFLLISMKSVSPDAAQVLENTLLRHKSISEIYLVEGNYDYLAKIEESGDDRVREIMMDLRNLDTVSDMLLFSAIDQIRI
jgi:Lrp/AsnC family leucine-responsive transcriptional regulator